MQKQYIFLLIIIISISFTFGAETWKYNYLESEVNLQSGANYSINVNNTQYFQGYTPATLWTYYTGLGNALWCQLTGCTMQGNIDMNGYNITNLSRTTYLNQTYGVYSNSTDIVFGYVYGL